jgi:hypothetical protein
MKRNKMSEKYHPGLSCEPIRESDEFYESDYKSGWINIKDRLPEKDGRYIVCEKCSPVWIGVCSLRKGKWDMDVIAWMELPKPPFEIK